MAVRLLAGPFQLRDADGVLPVSMLVKAWYPHVGLLCAGYFAYYANLRTHMATMDGICVMGVSLRPNWSWWPDHKRMVTMESNGDETVWEPKAFCAQSTGPADALEDTAENDMYLYRYVKLPDRRIYFRNQRIYRVIKGQGAGVAESDVFPFPAGEVNPGRSETDVWVNNGTNPDRGCFYDTVTREVSSPVYYTGMECNQLVYASDTGCWCRGITTTGNFSSGSGVWKSTRRRCLTRCPTSIRPALDRW